MAFKAVVRLGFALLSVLFVLAGGSANAQRTQVIVRPLYPPITQEEAQRYRAEKVITRVGTRWNEQGNAVDFAALYTPYAQMSSLAYVDKEYSDKKNCPDIKKLAAAPGDQFGQLAQWARSLQAKGWQCIDGRIGPLHCPPSNPNCNPINGLQLHVWVRGGNRCEPVIVFRGTDFTQIGDWISNFRWFNRLLPLADQYDQVGANITKIVDGACKSPKARVITAGHSLGGGLAQYAAFTEKRVRYAYTFDPSPVTGFDVPRHDRHKDRRLGIDRVHEAGEFLATPRYLIGGFIPARNCRPYTRYVRFNTIFTGLGISQHNMAKLAAQLERRAPLGKAANTVGRENEKTCEVDPDRAL